MTEGTRAPPPICADAVPDDTVLQAVDAEIKAAPDASLDTIADRLLCAHAHDDENAWSADLMRDAARDGFVAAGRKIKAEISEQAARRLIATMRG